LLTTAEKEEEEEEEAAAACLTWLSLATVRRRRCTHWGREGGREGGECVGGEGRKGEGGREGGREGHTFSRHISTTQ
jgi:hypothetical protein